MLAKTPPRGLFSRFRDGVARSLLYTAEYLGGGDSTQLLGFGLNGPNSSDGIEAGRAGRRLKNWNPSRVNLNTLMYSAGRTTLARARYLSRNNPYAVSAVDSFKSNLIGAGIVPTWKDERISKLFEAWRPHADSENVSDFFGFQRRVAGELFVAGECFIRRRPRYLSDGFPVPLQLQIIPAEQLPIEYNMLMANGNRVRQGVEYDKIGRRVAYHFWKVHPGDITQSQFLGQKVIVPATEILHIHDPIEAQQIRGWSRLTPTIVTLFTLDLYDDAELERKKTAALFSLFVRRPDEEGQFFADAMQKMEDKEQERDEVTLAPGSAQMLLPGEDVTVANPADVGPNYDAFQYRNLTRVCAALGLPYAGVTGDHSRANYSSQRSAILEMQRRFEAVQSSVMVHQLCRPIEAWFLQAALLAAAVSLPQDGSPEILGSFERAGWIPPRWDWVDPLKDIQAEAEAVNNGFKARSQVIREFGEDPVATDMAAAEDKKRQDKLGLKFAATEPKLPPQQGEPAKQKAET